MLYQPPGLSVLFLLFAGLFLALLTFTATAQISRTEVVRGHLSMDAGVTRVHAPGPELSLNYVCRKAPLSRKATS